MPDAYYFSYHLPSPSILAPSTLSGSRILLYDKRKLCLSSLNEEKFVAAISEPDETAA